MKYIKVLIIPFFAVVFLSACSEYQKVLKNPDINTKYETAVKYFNDEDYVKSLGLLEQLVTLTKGTIRAEDVFYYYSYCHYYQNDYILGGHYFRSFAQTYPRSEKIEEVEYMGAYCYYLDSPRSFLDQSNTALAIDELQIYVLKYPKSERKKECNTLIDLLQNKLEDKSYTNSKLYFDLGYYKAAVVSLKNSIKDYPDSKYREELMFYSVKASFLLAENSVIEKREERYKKVLKEYKIFNTEFSESKYSKEANKMKENTEKRLEKYVKKKSS